MFVKRAIGITLVKSDGITSSGTNTLNLSGYRCEAIVTNPGFENMFGNLQMRVFGMRPEDMNLFSTNGMMVLGVKNDNISVLAGDYGSPLIDIFDGTIYAAYTDYSAVPEVAFVIAAQAAFYQRLLPAAPNSYSGEIDVATTISKLAALIGYSFSNNNVNVKLRDVYVSGSIVDQIHKIAKMANVYCSTENNTVAIWPTDGQVKLPVISVSPETGLVGYPAFSPMGVQIKTLFNPEMVVGRGVVLTSSIPRANGEWTVQNCSHEISTLTANGSWFTTANLMQKGIVSAKF